jgi:Zn-dependent protease with chaperone function
MQPAIILAILTTVIVAENAPQQAVSQPWLRLSLALLGATVVTLFAWAVSRAEQSGRSSSRWRTVHTAVWLAMSLAVVAGLRWPQLVRWNWQASDLFLIDELLLFAPVLMPLLLSWAAFYDSDRQGRALPDAAVGQSERCGRLEYVVFRARHELLLPLLPVLVLLASRDLAAVAWPELLTSDYKWTVFALPLAGLVLLFPSLIQMTFSTEPLADGPLRVRLERALQRFELRVREILVWRTQGRILNAAVTGWLPRQRVVLLSDALLAELGDAEVEAVFLHEAAHLRQKHPQLRLLVLSVPAASWLSLQANTSMPGFLSSGLGPAWEPAAGFCLALSGVIGLGLVLGWYSRLLEHHADVWACRQLATRDAGQPLCRRAVERYLGTLEKLAGRSRTRGGAGWLHPTFEQRAEFLRQATDNPRHRSHIRRRLRLTHATLLAATAAPLAVQLLTR